MTDAKYQLLCDLLHAADFMSVSEAALWLRVSEHTAYDLLSRYWADHPAAAARERVRRLNRAADDRTY